MDSVILPSRGARRPNCVAGSVRRGPDAPQAAASRRRILCAAALSATAERWNATTLPTAAVYAAGL